MKIFNLNCWCVILIVWIIWNVAAVNTSCIATSCKMLILQVSKNHCTKSVQIRSSFWPVFSCIRTEYGDLLLIKAAVTDMRYFA